MPAASSLPLPTKTERLWHNITGRDIMTISRTTSPLMFENLRTENTKDKLRTLKRSKSTGIEKRTLLYSSLKRQVLELITDPDGSAVVLTNSINYPNKLQDS